MVSLKEKIRTKVQKSVFLKKSVQVGTLIRGDSGDYITFSGMGDISNRWMKILLSILSLCTDAYIIIVINWFFGILTEHVRMARKWHIKSLVSFFLVLILDSAAKIFFFRNFGVAISSRATGIKGEFHYSTTP